MNKLIDRRDRLNNIKIELIDIYQSYLLFFSEIFNLKELNLDIEVYIEYKFYVLNTEDEVFFREEERYSVELFAVEENDRVSVSFYGGTTISHIQEKEVDFIKALRLYLDPIVMEFETGMYPVIFDGEATGLLVHETVGHFLEADNIVECNFIRDYYQIGECISNIDINIIDDPTIEGEFGSYLISDDNEEAKSVVLVQDGVVSSYLHSRETALIMGVESNGHGRKYKIDDIILPRMSNTYLARGNNEVSNLFKKIKKGIYVIGSQDSCVDRICKLRGRYCYGIVEGKIIGKIKAMTIVSQPKYIWGQVKQIGNDFTLYGGGEGGCGKKEQWPLRVSSGGPHILIENLYCLKEGSYEK